MLLLWMFFFTTTLFFCGFFLGACFLGAGLGLAGVRLGGGGGGGVGGGFFLGGGGSFTDFRNCGTSACELVTLSVLSLSLMPLLEKNLPKPATMVWSSRSAFRCRPSAACRMTLQALATLACVVDRPPSSHFAFSPPTLSL